MGYVKNNFTYSFKSESSTLKQDPHLECFSLENYQTMLSGLPHTNLISKNQNKTQQSNRIKLLWGASSKEPGKDHCLKPLSLRNLGSPDFLTQFRKKKW